MTLVKYTFFLFCVQVKKFDYYSLAVFNFLINICSESKEKESMASMIPWKKIFTRFLLSMGMIFAVYWTSKKESVHVFASQKERLQLTSAEVSCSLSYHKDVAKFKGKLQMGYILNFC